MTHRNVMKINELTYRKCLDQLLVYGPASINVGVITIIDGDLPLPSLPGKMRNTPPVSEQRVLLCLSPALK